MPSARAWPAGSALVAANGSSPVSVTSRPYETMPMPIAGEVPDESAAPRTGADKTDDRNEMGDRRRRWPTMTSHDRTVGSMPADPGRREGRRPGRRVRPGR